MARFGSRVGSRTLKEFGIDRSALESVQSGAAHQSERANYGFTTPYLKNSNPNRTAIGVRDLHDNQLVVGNGASAKFTLQSVVKPLIFLYALSKGHEASEIADMKSTRRMFNEDPLLEVPRRLRFSENPKPILPVHPFNNLGAISAARFITDFDDFLQFVRKLSGNQKIGVDKKAFEKESESNDMNHVLVFSFASANPTIAQKMFNGFPEGAYKAVENYTKACSIKMSLRDLLRIGTVLANYGVDSTTGERLADKKHVVLALEAMRNYGLYNKTNEIARMTTGRQLLPHKSGVSGVILTVYPGALAQVTYGSFIDKWGNSVFGVHALKSMARVLQPFLAIPGMPTESAAKRLLGRYSKLGALETDLALFSRMREHKPIGVYRTNPRRFRRTRARVLRIEEAQKVMNFLLDPGFPGPEGTELIMRRLAERQLAGKTG